VAGPHATEPNGVAGGVGICRRHHRGLLEPAQQSGRCLSHCSGQLVSRYGQHVARRGRPVDCLVVRRVVGIDSRFERAGSDIGNAHNYHRVDSDVEGGWHWRCDDDGTPHAVANGRTDASPATSRAWHRPTFRQGDRA